MLETPPMAKKTASKKRPLPRPAEERIAELEARIAELKTFAKGREKFSIEALKEDRKRLDVSAADYAELAGVSMVTIYSWESGRCRPRPAELKKWLAAKGMRREEAWKRLGIEEVTEFSPKAVRDERERLGLTVSAYARLVGVSVLTIYDWEKGAVVPREPALRKWLAVRGIGKAQAERRLAASQRA